MREGEKKQRFFFDSLLSFLSPLLYHRSLFSPSIPPMMKAVSRVSAQVRRIRPRNARPRQENEGCPLLSIATPFSHRSVFSFQPRSTATPSSFLFFPAPPPQAHVFPAPPFPTISQYYRPSHRRRRRRGPPRPLLPPLLRFPRQRRLAARRLRRRSRSPSPSGPLLCCLPGPRPRKVRLDMERERARVDIEIGIGEGAKARKKVAILSSVAAWTRKKTSSCSNLSFFLSSLSPSPPDNNKQASSPPSRTPRTATSSRTPLAGRRSREF